MSCETVPLTFPDPYEIMREDELPLYDDDFEGLKTGMPEQDEQSVVATHRSEEPMDR